ncbi:MAG: DUF4826 family protein [Gammaproteobacteria bacterium]|nr:DUF4826 family protein [Gammaproteobacteria bacterium]
MSNELELGLTPTPAEGMILADAAPAAAPQVPAFDERAWEQSQYARALKYCTDKGLRVVQLDKRNSRVLPPYVALWLVSVSDYADKIWVLTGDLPADHVSSKAAAKARDALKHFSLSWQLKAESLGAELRAGRFSLGSAENQAKYASLLVHRAHHLYVLTEEEGLWAKA